MPFYIILIFVANLFEGTLFRHCFFVFHFVGVHFSDIVFFRFFKGLQASGGISYFLSRNFMSNAVIIMSGDAFLARVMTIFKKTSNFAKVELGDTHG